MTPTEHRHSDPRDTAIERIRGIVNEENIEHFSNDALLDACLNLVSADLRLREDNAAAEGPERASAENARHVLLDHITTSTTADEGRRRALRVALETLYDRRPSKRVRNALDEAKTASSTHQTIAGDVMHEAARFRADATPRTAETWPRTHGRSNHRTGRRSPRRAWR